MPSITRNRNYQKINAKSDGFLQRYDYPYNPFTEKFEKTYRGEDQLPGYYEVGTCYDKNNRHNSDFHITTDRNTGYIDGGIFFLTKKISRSPRVEIGELTYIGGGPMNASNSVEGEALSTWSYPVDSDTWTDDNGLYHNPFGWDPYSFILRYLNRARNDLRPDLPKFSLFRELVELRDVPGLIRDTREQLSQLIKRAYKPGVSKTAGNYLALQFGYLPIVSAVKSYLDLYRNISNYIQQLIRDDGKQVRRRRSYIGPEKSQDSLKGVTSWTRTVDDFSMFPGEMFVGITPTYTVIQITEEVRCWAVGTYQYHLPAGPRDLKWANKLAKKLAGFYPTASSLYQLVPWTWLLDWFSSIGSFLNSQDPGVAERGAYSSFHMMASRRLIIETSTVGQFSDKTTGDPVEVALPQRTEIWTKFRYPFGPFDAPWVDNLDINNMTDFQKSILGAISIQKFGSVLDKSRGFW